MSYLKYLSSWQVKTMEDQTRAMFFVVALATALVVVPAEAGAQEGEWRRWGGPRGDFMTDSTGLAES